MSGELISTTWVPKQGLQRDINCLNKYIEEAESNRISYSTTYQEIFKTINH